MTNNDTIAAISSTAAASARIIVRISGRDALEIAARRTSDPMPKASAARLVMLEISGMRVPAWVYVFAGPRSYTGEDLVELHIPGSPLLARLLLEELIAGGARHAEAGEFTARTYFSGRIDLAEAEGVAATISASNEAELRAARQLLSGELSRQLAPIMDVVAETLALIEAGIDFSDEDITFIEAPEVARRIAQIDRALAELVGRSARFERLTHEPTFLLVGRPNAGKSTLLNALAGRERAIVSPIAGTTRDVLSGRVTLDRGLIQLQDAAGLELEAAWGDAVAEQMRMQVLRALKTADRIVLVRDLLDSAAPLALPRAADLTVWTKMDLLQKGQAPKDSGVVVSARTGEGLEELRRALGAIAFGSASESSSLALKARHLTAIAGARGALARAAANVQTAGPEILALDLREALDDLGQILGRLSPDDVLGRVFSTFCIGK